MKAEEIAPIQTPGTTFEPRRHQAPHTSEATRSQLPAQADHQAVRPPSQDRIRYSSVENANSQVQQIAQQIRHVNQTVDTIDASLAQLRSTLEQVVKIYPPYPPGSAERIEALRQFSAIRHMIDQLTVGGRDEGISDIIAADSKTDGKQRDLNITVGKRLLRFSRQPLHPGKDGLNLPVLPNDASDRQIAEALDQTIAAQGILRGRRQRFVADANRILSELG